MADQLPPPKRKPDVVSRARLNYDIPNLYFPPLSPPISVTVKAIWALLFYRLYMKYFSNSEVTSTPGGGFTLPRITPAKDTEVDSETFDVKFILEFYLAILITILYLWPFWKAYKRGTTLPAFLFSCFLNWTLSLVLYLVFLKLVQQYGVV